MTIGQKLTPSQRLHSGWIGGITALIFALDLVTPLGVATGALYLFVVLATLIVGQRNFSLFMGATTGILVVVGLFLSPQNGADGYAILNRIIQLAAIGAMVPLVLGRIASLNRLAANEERLDLALHATDEGIWDWPDMNRDQQWWAPHFYALLGYQPGSIAPSFSQLKALLHPDDHAPTLQSLEDHLKNHVSFDVACRLKTQSNEYRWFRVRGKSAQRDLNGPIRMVGSIDDITQQKKAEEKFRLVIEAAPAGMLMIDVQGTIVLANERLTRKFGYSSGELLGQPIECLVPTRFQADHPPKRTVFFQSPTPRQMGSGRDLFGLRKDGSEFPVEIGLNPVATEEGTFVLASVIDISERKKHERHLKELSNRLTLATQSAELGIWEWNIEENSLKWDSQMYALYGLSPDSEYEPYTTWSNALHPEDQGSSEELLQKAIRGEADFQTEFRIFWPDRSIHWIKTTGLVERDAQGTAFRMIGINWDSTDSKESEKAILQYTRDLEVSNRELDDFAYITSHDLKEPLRGIANYGRFLLEDHGPLLPEEGKEQCQTIIKLTQRMESLIESLRYYSQLGRADLAIAPVSLDDILDDIILTLTPRLEETQVTIKRPAPFPTWPCDAIRIREALANLITNAMKYNDKEEKWIELTSQTIADSGQLEIAVRDNGIGIPEVHRQNIFRIFRRLHGRDKFGGGDGAGLTIVKKIVERHGGTIRLESVLGEGTTFFIVLPFLPREKRQDS